MSDNRNKRRGEAGGIRPPIVLCPKCHKEHYGAYPLMDEFINCECGFSFYAFVDRGLRIMMTPQEAMFEPIARAMRRFVVATGRCQDIDPKLLEYTDQIPSLDVQERDLDDELARVLEEYQLAAFGECFITRELIDSICKFFGNNMDVVLMKQKDGVDIREMKKPKRVPNPDTSRSARLLTYNARIRESQRMGFPTVGGIMRSCQNSDARMIGQ